ncbi:hypothetical protein DFR55_10647 [Herbinix hemicellulosilytica]|uniref:Uncharacterized protein n=1 Tax=Herbinix hemicellulosilytica TaxID=1564487 RepID=A0A0H5SH74_HERHM|nr:hypothetical protein [Herbinix hemicellulosilytica]RBP59416.1 hypothetical protein DFR55_10647 [Herbinix hemicellulosilytica]CRZ34862.1 hypothetical protein HHT355_1661 [Herbinix hemicellulosilytica]
MKQLVLLLVILTLRILTPMEALDIVKEEYALNFTKVYLSEDMSDYYYKLDGKDYYLAYEETDEASGNYLIRLYEFVVDDPDLGLGHIVTYGFFWVDPTTADIFEY